MCDFGPLPPLDADEYRLDTSRVREFVAHVREHIARAESPAHACELIGPLFADLLADRDWLPTAYQEPAVGSGMGGGIGQWLGFRAADRAAAAARRHPSRTHDIRGDIGVDPPGC
jgi:3-mercaptopropionate dioxygenase